MKDKYQWEPGASSPQHYPAEPAYVRFTAVDGSGGSTPSKPISDTNPWGENGISSVGSGEPKLLPVKLDIKWLSYVENQFYTGSFDLPYEKILTLFKTGYTDYLEIHDNGKVDVRTDTYYEIIAGMAPGGVVVVWLSGSGFVTEVARFQATKTNMDLDAFNYSLDKDLKLPGAYSKFNLREDGQKYLAEKGIPFGIWDTFREHFNWRPIIRFDQHENIEPNLIYVDCLNGEKDKIFGENILKNPFKSQCRPSHIGISWSIPNLIDPSKANQYGLSIIFDEDEMLKAYAEVYGNDAEQQGELIVDIDRANRYYRCYLLTRGKKVELKKMQGVIATND